MKRIVSRVLMVAAVALLLAQSGCVGSVGFSIPIGGGYGWGPSMSVGMSIPIGYPY